MNNKHMTLSNRSDIEIGLNNGDSIRKIARDIIKSHCTVLYEIKIRKIFVKGNSFNLMPGSSNDCDKLLKSPYVCNGCNLKRKCRKNKFFYYAKDSQNDYQTTLVEARLGIDMQCDKFNILSDIVNIEVKEQSHSFYMIKTNHASAEPMMILRFILSKTMSITSFKWILLKVKKEKQYF